MLPSESTKPRPGAVLAVLALVVGCAGTGAQSHYLSQTAGGTSIPGAATPLLAAVGVGDLDFSGVPDLAAVMPGASQWAILVYRDPFVIGFGPPVATISIPAATTVAPTLAVGDVTGDGVPDLVVAQGSPPYPVMVYAGDGSGSGFLPGVSLPWTASVGIELVDFDGDGVLDILCRQMALTGGVFVTGAVVAFGGRSPSWSSNAIVPIPNGTLGYRAGRLDADPFLDIAFVDPAVAAPGGFSGRLGRCSGAVGGTFAPPMAYRVLDAAGTSPLPQVLGRTLHAVEDMDGDGLSDLVVSELTPGPTGQPVARVLYSGTNPSTLLASSDVAPLNWLPTTPLIADWDADGNQDLLWYIPTSAPFGLRYSLVRGLGGRTFDRSDFTYVVPNPQSSQSPVVEDFDGDSDTDIISLAPLPWVFIENFAIDGRGVAGTGGLGPRIVIDPPTVGNAAFGIGLADALPTAPGVLVVSLARTSGANPNAPWVSLAPTDVLIPFGSFGTAVTSAQGTARIPLPLPAWPALVGTTLYAQWAVLDPNGGFSSSSGALSLSPLRQIILR